jgi:hypothetical protein
MSVSDATGPVKKKPKPWQHENSLDARRHIPRPRLPVEDPTDALHESAFYDRVIPFAPPGRKRKRRGPQLSDFLPDVRPTPLEWEEDRDLRLARAIDRVFQKKEKLPRKFQAFAAFLYGPRWEDVAYGRARAKDCLLPVDPSCEEVSEFMPRTKSGKPVGKGNVSSDLLRMEKELGVPRKEWRERVEEQLSVTEAMRMHRRLLAFEEFADALSGWRFPD